MQVLDRMRRDSYRQMVRFHCVVSAFQRLMLLIPSNDVSPQNLICNQGVGGSSPSGGTNTFNGLELIRCGGPLGVAPVGRVCSLLASQGCVGAGAADLFDLRGAIGRHLSVGAAALDGLHLD